MDKSSFFNRLLIGASRRFYPLYSWQQKRVGYKTTPKIRHQRLFKDSRGKNLDLQQILNELAQNGVVAIEDFFEREWLDLITAKCEKMRVKYAKNLPPAVGIFDSQFGYASELISEGILRFYNIEQEVPEVIAYQNCPLIEFIGENYYGRKLLRETTIYQHNSVVQRGTRNWHIDSWINQLKPMLYLTDVNEGNGPFTYLLGSHKNNSFLLRKTFNCMNGVEKTDVSEAQVKALGLKVKEFHAKKGTLIIADTKGIHQGGTLTQGERAVLVNYCY